MATFYVIRANNEYYIDKKRLFGPLANAKHYNTIQGARSALNNIRWSMRVYGQTCNNIVIAEFVFDEHDEQVAEIHPGV